MLQYWGLVGVKPVRSNKLNKHVTLKSALVFQPLFLQQAGHSLLGKSMFSMSLEKPLLFEGQIPPEGCLLDGQLVQLDAEKRPA